MPTTTSAPRRSLPTPCSSAAHLADVERARAAAAEHAAAAHPAEDERRALRRADRPLHPRAEAALAARARRARVARRPLHALRERRVLGGARRVDEARQRVLVGGGIAAQFGVPHFAAAVERAGERGLEVLQIGTREGEQRILGGWLSGLIGAERIVLEPVGERGYAERKQRNSAQHRVARRPAFVVGGVSWAECAGVKGAKELRSGVVTEV